MYGNMAGEMTMLVQSNLLSPEDDPVGSFKARLGRDMNQQ